MNYFELHIGDLTEATAHLSILEDGAYGRLLRKYYATEKPLPADVKQVQRLIGARSKDERDAVLAVLEEFFELQDDGWHQSRCDAEIAAFHEKQAGKEGKRENAKERQRRARERRAHLFEFLRGHGIVPGWTTTTAELETLASRVTGDGESRPVTQPVTRDDTASQTPDTRHQSPDTSPQRKDTPPDGGGAGAPPAPADVIFGRGVPLLTAAGVSDRNARSMLGLMRKTHGDPAVIDAVQRCAEERPLEPVAWLQAALKQRPTAARQRRGPLNDAELAEANAASTAEARRLLGFGSQEVIDA